MYERILVPLDGSELAEIALPYAEELAGRLGSTVILLSVSESSEAEHYQEHDAYLQRMVKAMKHGAKRYRERPEKGAIGVESTILLGNPAEEIVDYADKEDIGLIVMATHGRSGVRRWALGSVADKVLRATQRPVALITTKGAQPDVREKGMMNRVIVPLDGSKEGEAVIPYIEELASRLNTTVVFLQVVDPGYFAPTIDGFVYIVHEEQKLASDNALAEAYLNEVADRLRRKGLLTETEVRLGNAVEEIIKLVDETKADMVAMSTHGRSGIGSWAFGSVADRVLRAGETPVLLIRALG